MIEVRNGEVLEEFDTFVNPEKRIPDEVVKLTSITDEMVADAPLEEEALQMCIRDRGEVLHVIDSGSRTLTGIGLIFSVLIPFSRITAERAVLPIIISVSYTHLDVYKRQARGTEVSREAYCGKG